ncbi:aspartate/glutamate racemase family protein [Longirhabdus pacifica]|uniref:aspartate/glutamate racemase family protein n=1 Tax=Longirhabdus pacifica TaxID=2305227 RepID=UPI001008BCC9|nr:aspartate/glutamate racemase family protein [Longirhabdus pacifica]
MKTIGLIGGMSWESSAQYYRILNEAVKKKLGGLHSAKCILYNVDFAEIEQYQKQGDWEQAGTVLRDAALALEKAGADFIVICTNTMHKVVPFMEEKLTIPILHIADATAKQIQKCKLNKVGLLGTMYTMEQDFYKSRMEANGITVVVPDKKDMETVNRIIFKELCLGEIKPSSKADYQKVIHSLVNKGAEGIILGCTEIGLLIKEEDSEIPIFDTTIIHAMQALDKAMAE